MNLKNKNYIKFSLSIFLFSTSILFSQVNEKEFVFKDGVNNSEVISSFIKSCVNAFKNSGYNSENDYEEFCLCTIEKITLKFNYDEFVSLSGISLSSSSNKIEQADTMWRNKKIQSIIMECINGVPNVFNSVDWEVDEKKIEVFAKQHLQQIKDESISDYNELSKYVNLKEYSECYSRKILSEFKMEEFLSPSKDVLTKIDRIMEECISQNIK